MQRVGAILSTVARPALLYFYTSSLKRQDFRKKIVIVHKNVFSFYLQLLSETFLTVREDNDHKHILGFV